MDTFQTIVYRHVTLLIMVYNVYEHISTNSRMIMIHYHPRIFVVASFACGRTHGLLIQVHQD